MAITNASTGYLESIIGFVPKTSVSIGLEKVIEWINSRISKTEINEWIKSSI